MKQFDSITVRRFDCEVVNPPVEQPFGETYVRANSRKVLSSGSLIGVTQSRSSNNENGCLFVYFVAPYTATAYVSRAGIFEKITSVQESRARRCREKRPCTRSIPNAGWTGNREVCSVQQSASNRTNLLLVVNQQCSIVAEQWGGPQIRSEVMARSK